MATAARRHRHARADLAEGAAAVPASEGRFDGPGGLGQQAPPGERDAELRVAYEEALAGIAFAVRTS